MSLGQAEDKQQNKLVFEKLPGDQQAGNEKPKELSLPQSQERKAASGEEKSWADFESGYNYQLKGTGNFQ